MDAYLGLVENRSDSLKQAGKPIREVAYFEDIDEYGGQHAPAQNKPQGTVSRLKTGLPPTTTDKPKPESSSKSEAEQATKNPVVAPEQEDKKSQANPSIFDDIASKGSVDLSKIFGDDAVESNTTNETQNENHATAGPQPDMPTDEPVTGSGANESDRADVVRVIKEVAELLKDEPKFSAKYKTADAIIAAACNSKKFACSENLDEVSITTLCELRDYLVKKLTGE